jgi:hypothetical protein
MNRRPVTLLLALVVGVTFATGLFLRSWVGGILLLVVTALLVAMARLTWTRLPARGRPLRVGVIVVIAALGVVKLVHG